MEEVKLWRDKREREMYDSFADLYAIIKTTDKLEKAYVRDLVSSAEYEAECLKLIAQFRTLHSALRGAVPSLDRFAEAYRLDAPAGINRLLVSGVPATVEHRAAGSSTAAASAAAVAECVQHFITAMDSVKLNMVAVDQVHPPLRSLHLPRKARQRPPPRTSRAAPRSATGLPASPRWVPPTNSPSSRPASSTSISSPPTTPSWPPSPTPALDSPSLEPSFSSLTN
ncbi:Vacuolar protein sorting-associated protein [Musa troglodytarum]|uniref:Vacuolar protein sorting-associated protein n=1 Tax=Musa troglodytarum TaxID=320322 RepID=A0A9E7L233_9LILI|nr:Vacuolar protein sorting-associated protein [Musa troglodytarum]